MEFKAVKVLAGFFDSLSSFVEVTIVYIKFVVVFFYICQSIVSEFELSEISQLSSDKSIWFLQP